MEQKKSISLADLNLEKASGQGFDMELLRPDGTGMGVFIKVLGEHAEKVQIFLRRAVNDQRQRAFISAKRKGGFEPTPVEDDISFNVESAMVRTIGWIGIDEAFTPDNARLLFQTNEEARNQVIAASRDIGNFMKA